MESIPDEQYLAGYSKPYKTGMSMIINENCIVLF
jgi:hypothetical protein